MYKFIRPLLFNSWSDPETTHNLILKLLGWTGRLRAGQAVLKKFFQFADPSLEQEIFDLKFKNPAGLAGGFDKNAQAVLGLQSLGFGFLEIGTITRHAQPGNLRPRIFRLAKDQGLINRMGFNNQGADAVAARLAGLLSPEDVSLPLGISLGKSKITPLENATDDYLYSFSKLYEFGDYFIVNVSSPNTPGLRKLMDKNFLVEIISVLYDYRAQQGIKKPLLVKLTVDLSLPALDEVLEVCRSYHIDGIICSNTIVSRENLKTQINEAGGLSGRPLKIKSTEIIKYIHQSLPVLPIVGVGGIFSGKDAYEKILAGASLVQVYTGLIYEGPGLVKKINQGLVNLLRRDGLKNISKAVGKHSA